MKIERHVIQGLEPSHRVVDVDLAPTGEPVALVREANGTDGRLGMLFRGQTLAFDMPVRFPLIRALDGKEVIIADSRIRREGDLNARILASTGDTILRFSAGDAIENILVSGTDIVVGYFDEGGMTWPGQEGLAVFESTGRYKFGYNGPLFSAGEECPFIMDCYATCLYGERHVAFHFLTGGRTDEDFLMGQLDLSTLEHAVFPAPRRLHGAGAITSFRDGFLFHAPYNSEDILSWAPGGGEPEVVGSYPRQRLRGLRDGRFIAVKDDGYEIVSFD